MEKPDIKLKKLNVILLGMVIVLSTVMVLMNYYTIKILSASRAYINGESQYSKGQKEASGHLIAYIYNGNPTEYSLFKTWINIPIGDRLAREALSNNKEDSIARRGFLQAKNHTDDINDMIWLFNSFKHVGLFEKAISIWKDGDALVDSLRRVGLSTYSQTTANKIKRINKDSLITKVNTITTQLTIKERAFSDTLGIVCRAVNFYLFVANIVILLLIVVSSILYASHLIRDIDNSHKKIAVQNENLTLVNKDLDQLIYSVTHDLRAPLSSLSGLIELIDDQTDLESIKEYTELMKISINKQNQFIQNILNAAQKKSETSEEFCSLDSMIDDIIAQNHKVINGKQVKFSKELHVADVFCNSTKLQAILNNLISNGIKYADINKDTPFIKIRSLAAGLQTIIEVQDNGIGIDDQNKPLIFDKYFVAKKADNNMGIGLYLVKNMAQQMRGDIDVQSKPGVGSTFILKLPAIAN
jgi:signal transduction histidine kinase